MAFFDAIGVKISKFVQILPSAEGGDGPYLVKSEADKFREAYFVKKGKKCGFLTKLATPSTPSIPLRINPLRTGKAQRYENNKVLTAAPVYYTVVR